MNPSAFLASLGRLLLLLALLPVAHAGVYKCTDEHQRVFYQDRPCQELKTARLPSHISRLEGQAEQHAFLWKAVSGKGTAYLMGSLHFGSQDMYPLPAPVMEAFNASNVLVVEANPQNQRGGESAQKLAQAGTYAEDDDLESHVKPATWQKLTALAKNLGLPEETLRRQKPWLAILSLSALMYEQAGLSPELGLDRGFIKEAGTRVPILELESMEQQIKLFDSLTGQEQEQMLIQAISDFQRGPEQIKSMVDAWKKGDEEAMDLIVTQSFRSDPLSEKLYKLLFADRNAAMANKLEELMADGRTYFMVVGAGHLGGEKGILKLLEQKGYKITQP
jgi:uncharacterized protein YbaP (TraB family)